MLGHVRFASCPSLQLSAYLLRWRVTCVYKKEPRVMKKIMIVIGIIIAWEQRDSIVPALESVVSYVIATGSSLVQSV
jgi:hypothetical protein